MTFPAGITVTVQTRTQDHYGDRTTTSTTTVAGCAFAPGSSTEKLAAEDQVSEVGTLFMPTDSAVDPTKRIVLPDGTVWEVNGTPSPWQSPWTGWAPGIAVPLQRVTG